VFRVFLIFDGRIMPRATGRINPPKPANPRPGTEPGPSDDTKNLLAACTNRAPASQIAALLLVDFETVDIR
jgi:hypothetical protein